MKRYIVQMGNKEYEVYIKEAKSNGKEAFTVTQAQLNRNNNSQQEVCNVEESNNEPIMNSNADNRAVLAPMSGKILTIKVEVGDKIEEGEELMTIEAMKMETEISAPVAGTISEILVTEKTNCKQGDRLVLIVEEGDK